MYISSYRLVGGMYHEAFDTLQMEEAVQYFDRHGFVVITNIYTAQECQRTRDAMSSFVESKNPGLNMSDPHSWDYLKGSGKYGLSSRGPCFDPVLVDNRQNPALCKVLARLIDAPLSDLMVSHDRFTIYRATQLENWGITDGLKYLTDRSNIHLDLNPWWHVESSAAVIQGAESLQYKDAQDFVRENNYVVESMGRHVQCILNFMDNVNEDGGTLIVPGFHFRMASWANEHAYLRRPLPWMQFNTTLASEEMELLDASRRVSMREGSVLIWDQRVAHGSCPNRSSRCRFAQFLKAFPRSKSFRPSGLVHTGSFNQQNHIDAAVDHTDIINSDRGRKQLCVGGINEVTVKSAYQNSSKVYSTDRLIRRAKALKLQLEVHGSLSLVTALGATVFGLDVDVSATS